MFYFLGHKTLWWNQQARHRKLQSAALGQIRFKGSRYQLGISKGSPKQAVCPFCFKVFYDKSTMNRHVSKRVCLGLQFNTVDFTEETEIISEIVPLSEVKSRPSSPLSNVTDLSPDLITSEGSDKLPIEDIRNKSNKMPCPYCKKLMKGERGVRKHIDFYGCPMQFAPKC